jgi:hypothetical protein
MILRILLFPSCQYYFAAESSVVLSLPNFKRTMPSQPRLRPSLSVYHFSAPMSCLTKCSMNTHFSPHQEYLMSKIAVCCEIGAAEEVSLLSLVPSIKPRSKAAQSHQVLISQA